MDIRETQGMVSTPSSASKRDSRRDEGSKKISEIQSSLMEIFDSMPSNPNERTLIVQINTALYRLESLVKNQPCDEVL
jgi:hypothetical protein